MRPVFGVIVISLVKSLLKNPSVLGLEMDQTYAMEIAAEVSRVSLDFKKVNFTVYCPFEL